MYIMPFLYNDIHIYIHIHVSYVGFMAFNGDVNQILV